MGWEPLAGSTRALEFIRDDNNQLYVVIVLLSGFALGCLLYPVLASAVPITFKGPTEESGIIGWVTVNQYPKQQDLFYYATAVAFLTLFPLLCLGGWMWQSVGVATWLKFNLKWVLIIDALSLTPSIAGILYTIGNWSEHRQVLLWTLLTIFVSKVILLGSYRWIVKSSHDHLSLGMAWCSIWTFLADPQNWLYSIVVLLAGSVFGWFLPLAAPLSLAPVLARTWPIWTIAFWLGWLAWAWLMSARLDKPLSDTAASDAFCFLPAFLMLGCPFLILLPGVPESMVLVFVIVVSVALKTKSIYRFRAWNGPAHRIGLFFSLLAVLAALAIIWAFNPHFWGTYFIPLDSDHTLSWINDGLHGKLVYKEFWYPYGPLRYYFELLLARLYGLDNYVTAGGIIASALVVGILYTTARSVFITWPVAFLAGSFIFFTYGADANHLRVYLGYLAVVSVATAAHHAKIGHLWLAGILAAVAFLYSQEVGLTALIACQAPLVWIAYRTSEQRWRQYIRSLTFLALGMATLLVPALIYGWATGLLPAFFYSTFGYMATVELSGGYAFPNILTALPTSFTRSALSSFVSSDIARYLYMPPLVYISAGIYLALRLIHRRELTVREVVGLTILVFGGLLFRVALNAGGASIGHAIFSALPAWVLVFVLIERIGLRCYHNLAEIGRTVGVNLCRIAGSASLSPFTFISRSLETVLLTGILLLYAGQLNVLNVLQTRLPAAVNKFITYYQNEAIPFTNDVPPANDTWTPIQSVNGGTYYFYTSLAPKVKATKDYLARHTAANEGIYAFPFAFRYNLLLDRATPLNFGPSVWAAAAAPADRMRLIDELESVRPRYIVYDDTEWNTPFGVTWTDRFPEVVAYLHSHYYIEQQIGGALILKRGELPATVFLAGDQGQSLEPVNADLASGIQLTSYRARLLPDETQPQSLRIKLCAQASITTSADYTLSMMLVDILGYPWVKAEIPPEKQENRTSNWVVAEDVCGRYNLPVPDVPAGAYQIQVGMEPPSIAPAAKNVESSATGKWLKLNTFEKNVPFATLPPSMIDVVETISSANQPFLVKGWFSPQNIGGRWSRWTSQTATARLTRMIEQNVFFVELFYDPQGRSSSVFTVHLDDRALGQVVLSSLGWQTTRFTVPEYVSTNGPITIRFSVDKAIVSPDLRRLGVVIKSFGFEGARP